MNGLSFLLQTTADTPVTPALQNIVIEEAPGGSFDVNLVRMVLEHAPARIATIEKDIQAVTERMTKLQTERDAVLRLLEAARNG